MIREKSDQKTTKTTLVTGSAGFIGFHLSTKLLEQGTPVVGFDTQPILRSSLKRDRIAQLRTTASVQELVFS